MKVTPAFLLAAMLAAGSPAAAADAKAYHQVLAAAHRDHFDEAERLAARTGPKALVKLVRWMEFSSRTSGSFAEVSAFIEANPDWPLQSQMQRHAEAAITAATPNAEVLAWFRKHPPVSVDGGMAFARALEATGRHDEAVETARRTWVEGGFGALQERQFLASFGDWIRPEDNWRRLDRLLWDKQEAPAQHMMLRVDVPHRQLAQARLALQGDRGNVESAIAAVPAALRDDPGLVYDRVRWRRQKDMDEEATELLNHPSRNKVRPDLWWQERGILARRALQKGLVSQAYQVASDNGLEPGTSQQADAEFLSGWIALRFLEDRETGAAHFQRLWDGATTSSTRARAAYWAGRAAEAGGEREQARAWYTKGARYVTAYYGQLSAARLDNHHWPLPPDPKPTAEDIKRFEGRDVVQAARLLIEAGEKDSLRAFFIRLNDIAETAGERALVGKLASHNGSTELAVVVARRADREGVTLLEAGWPTLPITVDNETEKALVLALIRQESNFHKAAVSSAGARGLMQLLPSTAAKVAKSIRVAYSPRKLDDPAFNVRVGSAYLDGLVSDFDGSYVLALASYNAGPGRARRWIREYGDPRDPKIDVVDWIESIPFTETRGYVQKVMESVEIYRRRLGHSGSGIEADLKRRGARRGTG